MQELMDLLLEEFMNIADKDDDYELNNFIEFAKDYLTNVNKPINITYLEKGLGLILSDGRTVSFCPQVSSNLYTQYIPITNTRSNPNTDLLPDSSIPITGKK